MVGIYWIDVLIVVIWVFYVWYGWGKGISEIYSELAAYGLGIVVVKLFTVPWGYYLVSSIGISREKMTLVAATTLMSLTVMVVYIVLRYLLSKLPKQHFGLGWYVLGGVLPSMVVGGIVVMSLSVLVLMLSVQESDYLMPSWFFGRAAEVMRWILM